MSFQQNPKKKKKNRIDPVTLNRGAPIWDSFNSFEAASQQVFIKDTGHFW